MATLGTRWHLDEDVGVNRAGFYYDGSGHVNPRNALTPVNGVTRVSATPPDGNAYAAGFARASSQYLHITDAAQTGLNPGTGDFSISLRFYTAAVPGNNNYHLIGKGAVGSAPQSEGYSILIFGDGVAGTARRLSVRFGCSTSTIPGGQCHFAEQFALSTWNGLVVTFDRDGNFGAVLNGIQLTPAFGGSLASMSGFEDTTAASNPNADFVIGAYSQNNGGAIGDFWDGNIDDVRYYDGLLTLGEARNIANVHPANALNPGEVSLQTARAGLARAGRVRAGLAPEADHLEAVTGRLRYQRDLPNNGDPTTNNNSWTVTRD